MAQQPNPIIVHQHINSKHGGKYLWSDILQVRDNLMWGDLD